MSGVCYPLTDQRTLKRIINQQRDEIKKLTEQAVAYQNWLILAKAHAETEVIGAVYGICFNRFIETFTASLCEKNTEEKTNP